MLILLATTFSEIRQVHAVLGFLKCVVMEPTVVVIRFCLLPSAAFSSKGLVD